MLTVSLLSQAFGWSSSQELRFGLWVACVSLWAHDLSCQSTSSPLPHLERWWNITFLRAPHDIVFLFIYRVLEKIFSTLICEKNIFLTLQCQLSGIFSHLKAFLPSYVWNIDISPLKILGNLTCWIVPFILHFLDLFSSTINMLIYWSKQAVVHFLVCLWSILFSTTHSPKVPSC